MKTTKKARLKALLCLVLCGAMLLAVPASAKYAMTLNASGGGTTTLVYSRPILVRADHRPIGNGPSPMDNYAGFDVGRQYVEHGAYYVTLTITDDNAGWYYVYLKGGMGGCGNPINHNFNGHQGDGQAGGDGGMGGVVEGYVELKAGKYELATGINGFSCGASGYDEYGNSRPGQNEWTYQPFQMLGGTHSSNHGGNGGSASILCEEGNRVSGAIAIAGGGGGGACAMYYTATPGQVRTLTDDPANPRQPQGRGGSGGSLTGWSITLPTDQNMTQHQVTRYKGSTTSTPQTPSGGSGAFSGEYAEGFWAFGQTAYHSGMVQNYNGGPRIRGAAGGAGNIAVGRGGFIVTGPGGNGTMRGNDGEINATNSNGGVTDDTLTPDTSGAGGGGAGAFPGGGGGRSGNFWCDGGGGGGSSYLRHDGTYDSIAGIQTYNVYANNANFEASGGSSDDNAITFPTNPFGALDQTVGGTVSIPLALVNYLKDERDRLVGNPGIYNANGTFNDTGYLTNWPEGGDLKKLVAMHPTGGALGFDRQRQDIQPCALLVYVGPTDPRNLNSTNFEIN